MYNTLYTVHVVLAVHYSEGLYTLYTESVLTPPQTTGGAIGGMVEESATIQS